MWPCWWPTAPPSWALAAGDQACGEVGDGRMLEPGIAGRLDRAFQPKVLAMEAHADHGRPHLRAHRPGARHHQPLQRQDGLCHRPGRPGSRRQVTWWLARCTCPRRVACAHNVMTAQQMLMPCCRRPPARCVHCHGCGGRLAPGQFGRAQDQERGHQGRSTSFDLTENPDILAAVAANAAVRPLTASALPPRANVAGTRARQDAAQGHSLIVGNLGPATFGRDDNALVLVDAQATGPCRSDGSGRADKLTLARALMQDMAQRLQAKTP
jgi:phosphopantothenoylcysteine decarboxylase/phosphopantothenate--cysteine ligase